MQITHQKANPLEQLRTNKRLLERRLAVHKPAINPGVADAPAPPGLRISQPALALARQENLDLEQLPRDRLITESWLRTQLKTAGADTMIAGLENDFDPQAAIIVYGGGGHGKSLIDLLRSLGVYSILGVVDDGLPSGELVMVSRFWAGQPSCWSCTGAACAWR